MIAGYGKTDAKLVAAITETLTFTTSRSPKVTYHLHQLLPQLLHLPLTTPMATLVLLHMMTNAMAVTATGAGQLMILNNGHHQMLIADANPLTLPNEKL